ncbi:MAG: type II secretion system protein [Lachnospiraceae bacterium]|nr:type II secretion system protein [Lachnospiraceae bacterium]
MEKKNNKGFSLIEIIVALAIMGLCVAGAVSLYSSLSGAKVNSAATKLDSQLSLTRTNTLTKKGDWILEVNKTSGKYYAILFYDGDGTGLEEFKKVELGDAGSIDIKYTKVIYDATSGTTTKTPGVAIDTVPMKIGYDNGSGACVAVTTHGVTNYYVGDITITDGKKTREISITRATGKHYLD